MKKANFNDYQLSSEILKAIRLLDFINPTKVQQQVIPVLLEQQDVIIKSQTGSGKTAAFAIPICDFIEWDENKPQVLVITPTRELAIQVKEEIFHICRFKRIKVSAIYGKSSFCNQEKELKQKTHVVVGTPGRIIDHIQRGTVELSKIKYLVIDEADEMLKMGFIEQIKTILSRLPKERVTVLLSATMPQNIAFLWEQFMKKPLIVEVEEQNSAIERIYQEILNVDPKKKIKILMDKIIVENPDSCIIFCNLKQMVDEVCDSLPLLKNVICKIHGGMEQKDRLRVMNQFKKGYFRYLVATDVVSRGIDVDDISLIINYDIPQDAESYVHRIGRTGRAGREGRAITLMSQNEIKYLDDIQKYIGKEIPLKEIPEEDTVRNFKPEFMEKINTPLKIRQAKGVNTNNEILKLHINAGKKTKMRAGDIVGTLCNLKGMSSEDIGNINILDISTFVEILNNKGKLALDQLQSTPIKGRLRKVSKAGTPY